MWDVPAIRIPDAFQVTLPLRNPSFHSGSSDVRQALAIAEYIYMVLAAAIKLSCLLFYARVFSPDPKTRRFIHGGMVFILAAYTAMFFSTLFQCNPIQKAWYKTMPGYCLPPRGLPYASGVINVVSDIYVLVLPISCIWGLNMKTRRKLRTLATFGLGILYDFFVPKTPKLC